MRASENRFDISTVEELDPHVGIRSPKQTQFTILASLESRCGGRYLNIDVEVGKIKIRCKGFKNVALMIPGNREALRFIMPVDVEEVEEMGEVCFAAMSEPGYARCHGPTSTTSFR